MANTKTNKKAAQAQTQAVEAAQAQAVNVEAFEAFNEALLAALALSVITADQAESMIVEAGFAVSEAEHEAARPIDKKAAALAALAAFMPAQANKAALALSLDALAKAAGKYGRYAVVFDEDNGTSCVSHYMLKTLAACGRVTLADTLAFARKTLPSYSSAGHYNTMKRLFKAAGYRVNVAQGSFSLSVE